MRQKNLALAHTVLFRLGLWIVGTAIVFGMAHLVTTDPILEKLPRNSTVRTLLTGLRRDSVPPVVLDGAGRVIAISDPDLRWQVGQERAAAIESGLEDRSRQITELRDQTVDQALLEFTVKLGGGVGATPALKHLLEEIEICVAATNCAPAPTNKCVTANNFELAAKIFTQVVEGWGEQTRQKVGETAIFELNYGLEELAALKRQQEDSAANLSPPRMQQIFWSSPIGALTEAVFWSFFGTLTNLMVNIAQARALGKFRSDELWVCWAKMIYGPVLSFVLILAIYFGIINAGTEVRFWLLPILGFFFGYNTRKVAMQVDALSAKLFGSLAKSTEIDAWQTRAAAASAANVAATAQPKTMDELKQQATHVSDAAVVAGVIKNQNAS